METRKNWKSTTFFAILPAIVLLALARFSDPEIVNRFTTEDGFIENLSAIFYIIGASICFYRIFYINQKPRYVLFIWMLLCILFFGEETSWLQRVIGFETPENIRSTQNEVNIHNLEIIQKIVPLPESGYPILGGQNIFRAGFILYFIVIPIIASFRMSNFKERYNFFWIPSRHFAISTALLIVITFAFSYSADSRIVKSSIGEIHEFFYAFIIMFYIIETLRTTRLELIGNIRREDLSSHPVAFPGSVYHFVLHNRELPKSEIGTNSRYGVRSQKDVIEILFKDVSPVTEIQDNPEPTPNKKITAV